MVGRRVTRPKREAHAIGAPLLKAEGVTVHLDGKPALEDVSFTVHAGRNPWDRWRFRQRAGGAGGASVGHCGAVRGRLTLESARSVASAPAPSLPRGWPYPRGSPCRGRGGRAAVWENSVLERLTTPDFATRGFVRRGAARDHAAGLIERFDVRGATPETRIRLCRGGTCKS
jgi:hypothetical protein